MTDVRHGDVVEELPTTGEEGTVLMTQDGLANPLPKGSTAQLNHTRHQYILRIYHVEIDAI
jgi:hypothetical protein